jgi:hypothetical protein
VKKDVILKERMESVVQHPSLISISKRNLRNWPSPAKLFFQKPDDAGHFRTFQEV